MLQNNNPTPPPDTSAVTLPQPRKITAELKRMSFARKSSSSNSKSFTSNDSSSSVIKRSTDMMTETINTPRKERSLSFDTQTPYFCRQSSSASTDESTSDRRFSLDEISRQKRPSLTGVIRENMETRRTVLSETIDEIESLGQEVDKDIYNMTKK